MLPVESTQPARLRPRGSNQIGMRQFNERVVLQALRLHGSLPKAELARITHLSSQTIALIIGRLMQDDLVVKQDRLRGKVGQPSVPIALNPDGAFSIGIKIGRRSLDVLMIDFVGVVRERASVSYLYPDPDTLFTQIDDRLSLMHLALEPRFRNRLCGIGIAAPLSLGGWQTLLGLAPAQAQKWQHIDIRERVAKLSGLPIELAKDTSAACVAELVAGRGRSMKSYLYMFLDTFIGGGLVIDSHLHAGLHGNAGAIASLPLGLARAGGGAPEQLLSAASLFALEQLYAAASLDLTAATDARALQAPWVEHTEHWLQTAASAIALAINSAACLLDVEGIILDGVMHRDLLERLLRSVHAALDLYSWEGVFRPDLLAGTVGSDARAMGGALLPLYAQFAPDQGLFLKLD